MSEEMVSIPRWVLVDMAHNQGKRVSAYMPYIATALAKPSDPAAEPHKLHDLDDDPYFIQQAEPYSTEGASHE